MYVCVGSMCVAVAATRSNLPDWREVQLAQSQLERGGTTITAPAGPSSAAGVASVAAAIAAASAASLASAARTPPRVPSEVSDRSGGGVTGWLEAPSGDHGYGRAQGSDAPAGPSSRAGLTASSQSEAAGLSTAATAAAAASAVGPIAASAQKKSMLSLPDDTTQDAAPAAGSASDSASAPRATRRSDGAFLTDMLMRAELLDRVGDVGLTSRLVVGASGPGSRGNGGPGSRGAASCGYGPGSQGPGSRNGNGPGSRGRRNSASQVENSSCGRWLAPADAAVAATAAAAVDRPTRSVSSSNLIAQGDTFPGFAFHTKSLDPSKGEPSSVAGATDVDESVFAPRFSRNAAASTAPSSGALTSCSEIAPQQPSPWLSASTGPGTSGGAGGGGGASYSSSADPTAARSAGIRNVLLPPGPSSTGALQALRTRSDASEKWWGAASDSDDSTPSSSPRAAAAAARAPLRSPSTPPMGYEDAPWFAAMPPQTAPAGMYGAGGPGAGLQYVAGMPPTAVVWGDLTIGQQGYMAGGVPDPRAMSPTRRQRSAAFQWSLLGLPNASPLSMYADKFIKT